MPMPRKPQTLKVLHGTDQPSRRREEADFPLVEGDVEPPMGLVSPLAVKEWNRLSALLVGAGVLSEGDLAALARLCNMSADAQRLWEAGMKPTAADLTAIRLLENEFGLTPASRSKPVKATSGKTGNKYLDAVNGQ